MKLPAGKEGVDANEYYGPMDGVRPSDYTHMNEDYLTLVISVCLKRLNNQVIYVKNNRAKNRMCEECYIKLQPSNYIKLDTEHLVHYYEDFVRDKLYCECCTKQVLEENYPAATCPDCTEEVLICGTEALLRNEQIVKIRY